MRTKKSTLFAFCVVVTITNLCAQDKTSYKFGKITAADFNLPSGKIDSGANAVIISDIGSTKFEGNTQGSFNMIYTRYMRVKIINKNGFDVGSRKLFLYHDEKGDNEKISSIKGSTFNLENGVVNETRLDGKSIFSQKEDKNYESRKFTLPALKEGSIFDLEYTIRSPFTFLLRSWDFQGEYPCLWSEYVVTIAPPFHYVMKLQGDTSFDINTTEEISSLFHIRVEKGGEETQLYSLTGPSLQHRWVKKNVPALHEEPFTTTIKNYNTSVSFQLNYFQWTDESERIDHMTDWAVTSKSLMEREDFGQTITSENFWMSDKVKDAVQGAKSDEEKVYNIFNYVRDNFSASSNGGQRGGLLASNSLKDVYKKKEGNVAEINLLLIAMLRKAGIDADPIILSTRGNGIANTSYPLIEEYNYVICAVYLNGKVYKLDASQPYIGFNQLPEDCYNGLGHVINEKKPLALNFTADSLHETSVTTVLIFNDEKGASSGNYKNLMGKRESLNTRREIGNSSVKNYVERIQTAMGSNMLVQNFEIDSLHKYDFPVTVQFDFEIKNNSGADILYFDPVIDYGYKVNPFKAMNRHYPVEMPYLMDEKYVLNMDIPSGFEVDEIPQSTRIHFNGNDGLFEYIIQKGETNIRLDVHFQLNKVYFPVEEYSSLREFFAGVVKMENEKIVFKKKH